MSRERVHLINLDTKHLRRGAERIYYQFDSQSISIQSHAL